MVAAIPDPDPLPEEVVEVSDQYGSLHEVIAVFPPKFRSIVFLHCFRQLTFAEIGHVLGIPGTTAQSYFYRSLPRLRRALVADARFASLS